MLHPVFEEAFDDLLVAWRSHQVSRNAPDRTVQRLAKSRFRLDQARNRVHRFRTALYPEHDERLEVALTILCPSLDTIVNIRYQDLVESEGEVRFECPCGRTITRPLSLENAS